jgi:hypothetical protein
MVRQGALAGVIVAAGLLAAGAALGAEASIICTNAGVQYKLGEFACIAACHGKRRLARCDAIAEKASWTYISDACPSAMINPPWPSDWTEWPAVAAMTPRPVIVNMSAIAPEIAPRIAHPRSFDLASR